MSRLSNVSTSTNDRRADPSNPDVRVFSAMSRPSGDHRKACRPVMGAMTCLPSPSASAQRQRAALEIVVGVDVALAVGVPGRGAVAAADMREVRHAVFGGKIHELMTLVVVDDGPLTVGGPRVVQGSAEQVFLNEAATVRLHRMERDLAVHAGKEAEVIVGGPQRVMGNDGRVGDGAGVLNGVREDLLHEPLLEVGGRTAASRTGGRRGRGRKRRRVWWRRETRWANCKARRFLGEEGPGAAKRPARKSRARPCDGPSHRGRWCRCGRPKPE